MMYCIKLFLTAVFILINFSLGEESSTTLRGSQTRNLKVTICFEGTTKHVLRRRVSYFLGLGATRGDCTMKCPEDARICSDGSYLLREPSLNCTFASCPDSTLTSTCCDPLLEPGYGANPSCREGYACCPDGTWACSIGDGKTFVCGEQQITSGFGEKCTTDNSKVCASDVKNCPDGSSVSRDPALDCNFSPCPMACQQDARLCPDGTAVVRDPKNNCEFQPCP